MLNQIIHGDCFEVLKDIPDKSIDAVITDPPYGIGLAKWDTVVDIPLFTKEVKRVSSGFYAFFGQMPTMVNWINEANNEKLHYCEHISWIKRNITQSTRLMRGHESIFIYGAGDGKRFCRTKGFFEDVKLPGILFDTFTIEGLDRYIKDMWIKLKTGELERRGFSNEIKQKEYKRFTQLGDRSPRDCNYTNVWSFLPPTRGYNKPIGKHPTGKPLEIMKRLVEMLSPEGGTVLDPFCGSGTTAVACKELNRNYICIEKEKEYFDIACDRISQPREYSELELEIKELNKPEFKQLSLLDLI